jgi:hypothetical protein
VAGSCEQSSEPLSSIKAAKCFQGWSDYRTQQKSSMQQDVTSEFHTNCEMFSRMERLSRTPEEARGYRMQWYFGRYPRSPIVVHDRCLRAAMPLWQNMNATPLYPQTLALSSPTSGGRSVGIVRSRTKATEFVRSWMKPLTALNVPAGCCLHAWCLHQLIPKLPFAISSLH